jgi:tetratricopeptide (TPR) repeat protein
MKSKILPIIIFFLILFFYGTLLVHKIDLPFADDLARQIKNGQMVLSSPDILTKNVYSYTEPEHPFVNHHWLSGVVFYLVQKAAGFGGLVIFNTIIMLTAFSILFLVVLKKAGFGLTALFSLPVIVILSYRSNLRPEMFSYLFIALYLYILLDWEKQPASKKIFWLIPLQLIWVNMHIFFLIGLLLVAGFLLEKIIRSFIPPAGGSPNRPADKKNLKNSQLIKKLAILLVILAAVCFINPNGAKGALVTYYQWQNYQGFPVNASELQPIGKQLANYPLRDVIPTQSFKPLALILALSFVFALRKKSTGSIRNWPIFYFLASVATVVIAYLILRGLILFSFIFWLVTATNFSAAFERLKLWLKKKWPHWEKIIGAAGAIVFLILVLYLGALGAAGKILNLNYKEQGIGLMHEASSAATFFKTQGLKGPIFNNADIGSYLIYYLYPQEKVFIDNRFSDAYSSQIFETFIAMTEQENIWLAMQQKYDFNSIFFYYYNTNTDERIFLRKRMNDPAWSLIYVDSYSVILIKNKPENQNIIRQFGINQQNVGEKLTSLLASNYINDQIGAGDIFNIIGQEDLALDAYQQVVANWPDRSRVWLILGEVELQKNDSERAARAVDYIKTAIAKGEKTAEAYNFLGLAYYRTGQIAQAKAALEQALKINPERQDAKDGLEIIRNGKP